VPVYPVAARAGVRRQHLYFSTYIKEEQVSGGPSFVAVMQSADLGQRHDSTHWFRLDRSRLGRILAQGEMPSRSVIVIQIRTKDTTQGRFVKHEHVVQALAPNRTNDALDVGPLSGGSRGAQHFVTCPWKASPKIVSRSRSR
jgi:hypothetical protein